MTRADVAAALLAVTGLLAGCGGGAAQDPADRSARTGTAASTPSTSSTPATPTPAPSPSVSQRPVTLAFGGDVHFADQVAALLEDPHNSLAELRPFLAEADLAVVNLETAITTRGTRQPKKYHFRAPASALTAVQAAGVDAVTMANNHAVDFGPVGLKDTLAAQAASPIPVVGIGGNAAQAYAPATFDVRGTKIALLGATQVPDWTRATWPATGNRPGIALSLPADRLLNAVRAADSGSDVVVVYLHWGTDYTDCPDAAQKRTVTALRRAGADVIVGGHAHRIQGSGWAGDSFVAYGLGNFVWYGSQEPAARTGVLTVTLDESHRPVAQAWAPLRISPDGVPRTPNAAGRERVTKTWIAARRCAGLASAPPP